MKFCATILGESTVKIKTQVQGLRLKDKRLDRFPLTLNFQHRLFVKGGQRMEIFVLVKQVPDPEAIVKVKSDSELDIENKYFTSFFDEIAVEAGLKLKEKFGGKVTVLTVDNRKVDALRRGISMGADEAIQITDPALEGSDQLSIAKALAAYLKDKPYDIILAGRQAMDDDAGIVGPAVG